MSTRASNILAVDDEPMINDMLPEAFEKKDYKVQIAHSGRLALEKLCDHEFEPMITDLFLPDLNGREILKKARSIDPKIGVTAGQGDVGWWI